MLTTIVLGSMMIILAVVIEVVFIAIASAVITRAAAWLAGLGMVRRTILVLSCMSLWLLAGISTALWCWAVVLLLLGEFTSIHDAIYFTTVSATTLGYGDVLLSDRWKLLSGFIAANGLVLFSLNTAFLFETTRRLNGNA